MASVHALMVREVRSRFTGDPLGYGWSLVTPLVWIGGMVVMFDLIGRRPPISTDTFSFLISGMLPFLVFRLTIAGTMRVLAANKYMVYFANISKSDIFLAGALMEYLISVTIFVILTAGNAFLFGHFELDNPAMAMLGFTIAWAIGASFGHMAAAFAEITDASPRLVPVLMRPMFWISGTFFVANEIPADAMAAMQYNPVLQAIEIMRTGVFLNYTSHYINYLIPFAFILAFNLVAVAIKIYTAEKNRTA
jgi:capsular polysaccharide transport system permease protein